MSRRLTRCVIVIMLAPLSAACGIPHDSRPRVLPGGIVSPALAPEDGESKTRESAAIFLVEAEHLVNVRRNTPRLDLTGALNLLLEGPTEAEFGAGIRSAISARTALRSAQVERDTAVVDVSGALVEVGGQEQILAVAQVVLTATAVPGIKQIRFLLEGQAVEVPRGDGTLTSEALRATDYAALLR